MPLLKLMSRILIFAFILVLLPVSNPAQGVPWYTIPLPIPNGFVDAVSGNVHLEIPLGSMPQRNGDPIVSKLVYDTTYYYNPIVISGVVYWSSYGQSWGPVLGNSRGPGGGTLDSSIQSCSQAGYSNYPNGSVTFWSNFRTTDIHRTTHVLAIGQPGPSVPSGLSTKQVSCYNQYGQAFGSGDDVTYIYNGTTSDDSGYTFQVTNYNQLIIHTPDGTLITDGTNDAYTNDLMPVDTNGNTAWPANTQLYSGLPLYSGCNTTTVKSSDGSPQNYTFTCANLSVSSVVNGTTYTGTESFLTSVALPDGSSYGFTYDTGTTGNHYGTLLSVTLPSGGTVSLTYTLTGQSSPSPMKATSVTYGGGTWNLSYVQSNCTTTCQSTTTVLAPSRYDSTSHGNVNDKSIFTSTVNPIGGFFLHTASQYYSGSSTLLRTVSYTPSSLFPSTVTTTFNDTGQSFSIFYQWDSLAAQPTLKQETDFTGTIIRTTKTAYGNFAKPTSINVYAGDGSSGSPVSSTLYTYDEYTANYCKNGVPMLVSFTGAYGHDDANFGTGVTNRGNVTTIQRLISGTTYSTTHMCYDTLGNVTQIVGANGNPTSFDYSENWADTYCIPSGTITHAFPTTITDALGHRTKKSYFSCTVLPQSTKDENDIQAARNGTTFTYDAFKRPMTVSYPDGGSDSCSYQDTAPAFNSTHIKPISNSPALSKSTKITVDALGRVAQTALTTDPDGATYTATAYDQLGHVSQVYNLTRCNPPTTNCNEPTWGYTTTAYDALGRVTQVTEQDGSGIKTTYSGNCATLTDEAAKASKSCTDALGRLKQVFEDPTGVNYETDYAYDALDNLTSVVQIGSRQRTFAYDSLSRLTQATNPESGTITYSYDANGNLTSKTSPAPNQTGSATVTVSFCYDALNRMTSKAYTAQSCPMSSPVATYTYDLASIDGHSTGNSVGRLVKAATSDGLTATWNSFDTMGRISSQWQCTPLNCGGTPYTKTFGVDFRGDHTSETYAYTTGTLSISYAYNGVARPTSVTSSYVDSQHPATLASGITYRPNGAIKSLTYGNNLIETFVHNNRLQPCRIAVNSTGTPPASCSDSNGGNVLDFGYGFNSGTANNGNVASWTAAGQQSFSRTFSYDALNRLATMVDSNTGQACRGLSWTIDSWGNRTDQTVTAGTCNAFHQAVDANNRLLGAPYQYDAAGNMIHDASHSYTYDAENHLTQADGGSTATYVYDANGRRARKTVGTNTSDYLYDLSDRIFSIFGPGCTAGCWVAGAVYLNGQFLAEYYNGSTYFATADHLGSSRLLTALNQSVYDSFDYLPFGEQIAGGSGTNLKFTGKERDSESALDNFGARYDSSSMGRFMSPDPANAGASIGNPQTWNAYSYVLNNPVNAIDPDGLASCAESTGGYFEGTVQLPDQACPQPSPTTPQPIPPDPTHAYDPSNSGTIDNAGGQPDLAASKGEGPGGGKYHGITVFDAMSCAAQNDPSDSACWGVRLSGTSSVNGPKGTWSSDDYVKDAKNYVELWEVAQDPFGLGSLPPHKKGYFLLKDPSNGPRLIDLLDPTFPKALGSPTAQTYSCQGFQLWIHANPSALLGQQASAYRLNCH